MANAIVIQSKVMAQDNVALNRVGTFTSAVPNGTVFTCGDVKGDVFTLTKATNAVKDVWLAVSPEVVLTDGKFLGIDRDVRNFVNQAGKPIDLIKLVPNVDVITVTEEFFKASKAPTASNKIVEIDASGDFVALASATSSYAGLSFKVIEETYIVVATGAICSDRLKAWKLEVTQN